MMNTKWIVVAVVTAATLTNGCMAFKEISGNSRGSSSSGGDDAALAESDRTFVDEAAGHSDVASHPDVASPSDAAGRSEAAAARAEAVAARASMQAEKTESGFRKGLRK